MQPINDKTNKLFFGTEREVFDLAIPQNHPFRKLNKMINFTELTRPLRDLYSELGTSGVAIEKGFKALLVQFWEDYSDREMEKAVREKLAQRRLLIQKLANMEARGLFIPLSVTRRPLDQSLLFFLKWTGRKA